MADVRLLRALALLIAVCASVALFTPATPLDASVPSALPAQSPTPPPPMPPPSGDGNPITQIINQIIQFPFENLVEALQNAAKSILNGTVTPLETFFSASIGRWVTSSPGIITPGGGIANGSDVMGPAWRLMVKVAVLLWPLTLAIIAAIAAKDAVAAASWGIGDLKEALGGWLIAVVASATSLYWMDLANRFTNATTMTILDMSFTGEAGFQSNALTALVFGTAGILLTMVALPASLVIVIFVILMGLAVLSALIFQFLARFVILYILVALAPVVLILGVVPPLSWFRYMWLRGFVLVEAIGPINALLLKLVMILAVRGPSNDPITAFVNFIGAIGVLSILLTVDGIIVKGVFGAAGEVMQKAVGTVTALGTLALAGVTALAGGSIAAGAAAAAGTTLGSGGGGAGGSAGLNVPSSASPSSGATTASSPASIARNAFNPSTALRSAGEVLYRQPGMLGSVGAAMRSLGGTMERQQRDEQTEARLAASPANNQDASRSGDGRTREDVSKSSARDNVVNESTVLASGIRGAASAGGNQMDGIPQKDAEPNTQSQSNDVMRASQEPSLGAMPPPQTPSVSPLGSPLSTSSGLADTNARRESLSSEAANVVGMLPGPLGERAGEFASIYPDPRQQVAAARATVDAFNQVNNRGQGFYDISWQAGAWDRSITPVFASARQGLPLETMAQDAGFGGNVSGFLANRMLENREPSLQVPAHAVPWHPQMAPHDWEMGAAVSNALSNRISHGAAARVYHEVRSPETGGGWSAGEQFIQTVQEIFQKPATDPIAALDTRLAEMESRGVVSKRAMTLWRANIRNK